MPFIVVVDGGTKKVFPLGKDVVNVGRSSKSDVRLDNNSISRLHCRFIRTENGTKVKDLGSRNGTFVNRVKVEEYLLADGDEVTIGDLAITFLLQKPPVDESADVTQPLSIYDEKTSVLLETILASIQIRELDRFLPVVVDNVLRLTQGERGIIFFKDGERIAPKIARDKLGVTIENVAEYSQKIPTKVLESGQPIYIKDTHDESARSLSSTAVKYNLASIMCVPLKIGAKVIGAIYVDSHMEVKEFTNEDLLLLGAVANHIALAIENVRVYEEQMVAEIAKREDLERENIMLKGLLEKRSQIVGECPQMTAVYDVIRKAAPTEATVLIEGESGTGKEAMAHLLHDLSPRAQRPFVVVDCAAIPETLLESELFGYEKGAFTGALQQKIGKFEFASSGTIFLDEISDLSPALQAKLLRAIQEREVVRVGGLQPIKIDVRVLAATNRNLQEMVKETKFRQDLFFRLNVVLIRLPPLRERGADIRLLGEFFLNECVRAYSKNVKGFDVESRDALLAYNWPGNVRELKHRIERAVILTNHELLTPEDLDLSVKSPVRTLDEARDRFEKQYIYDALNANKANVTRTAMMLGISRQHLQNLIKKHNL